MNRHSVWIRFLFKGIGPLFLLSAVIAAGQPEQLPRSRQFPPGTFSRIEDLPEGRLRTEIERLPAPARDRAIEWLRGFHFTELDLESLHADPNGAIFYADIFALPSTSAEASIEPPTAQAAVPVSPFPASVIFPSKPGAPNVLYLNFAGDNISGTAWNSSLGRDPIPAVAFSTDSDFSTFSDSEQVVIKRVWQRVAEDYAPFDIDVTTERPATFTSRTAHALITQNTDADGNPNPSSSAGGVAYINVFASAGYAIYRPGWIYFNNLANTESYIAEAVSHEIGHNFGLSHDGKTDGTAYYGGHGSGDTSWGPLMGTGYGRNVSQWSKGEYYLANNTEDDLAIISGKAPYRIDDHGNTPAAASSLVLTGGTNIVSTTPESDPANVYPANKGILERNTDVDVFSFVTGNGPVSLTVNPWVEPSGTRGGNLDVLLELRDGAGALILTNNPASLTTASIQTNLPEGLYCLYVRNTSVGDPMSSTPSGYTAYGSIGQYFISGFVTSSSYVPPPSAQLQVSNVTQTGVGGNQFTVTYSGAAAIDVSTIDGQDVRISGPNGYDRAGRFISVDFASDGTPRVSTYSADPMGATWTANDNGTYTIWMQSNQVSTTSGSPVAPGPLGQFMVDVPVPIYAANLEANPGWTLEPLWQYGPPAYISGGPTAGFTGANIIGYNLTGSYENNLSVKYATTPAINCSGISSLTLRFQRWLRLKNNDVALIQVSTNAASWTDVWSTSQSVSDDFWQQVQYALPAWAAGSATVRLRWGISSGPSQNDIGWNIDDVELLGTASSTNVLVQLTAIVNNPAWGTVSPTNGVYVSGTSVQVVAVPASYFRLMQWTNGVSGTNNPVTVVVNTNVAIEAMFGEVLTTNYPTPYWWLASFGYTNNFETAVRTTGANGIPLWQSYIAGLNPTNPTSQFRVSFVRQPGGTNYILSWNTVTGRMYTVWRSTNLLGGFIPVSGASNLPSTTQSFTNAPGAAIPTLFYRVEVRKP